MPQIALKGKVVVITGSSLGIGRETAFKFAREGCRLAITYYKDKEEGVKTSKECLALGASDCILLQLNVKDDKSIKNAVKKIADKFGKIDILVNNAGVVAWKRLEKQSDEEIDSQIDTNLRGLIKTTKYCLPYVKETIINIASGAGLNGFATLTTYCATKFGVRGFTQALAEELQGIKVFSVNPGMTATRMTNFKGVAPEKVAEVVLNTAKGIYKVKSGGDVNVWEHV
ncbi:MAG TPA: SDR family oxidoreductase [Candidatus Nanoarchaeia archaeon]|nr:SDR family oxidoreductase [Candidatus Nanoarchaeia archaeon]